MSYCLPTTHSFHTFQVLSRCNAWSRRKIHVSRKMSSIRNVKSGLCKAEKRLCQRAQLHAPKICICTTRTPFHGSITAHHAYPAILKHLPFPFAQWQSLCLLNHVAAIGFMSCHERRIPGPFSSQPALQPSHHDACAPERPSCPPWPFPFVSLSSSSQ